VKIKPTLENLLTFILIGAVCWLGFRSCTQDEPADLSGYIKEFNTLQIKVDSSVEVITRLDSVFDSINTRLTKKYEAIDTANPSELRDLFNNYFGAK